MRLVPSGQTDVSGSLGSHLIGETPFFIFHETSLPSIPVYDPRPTYGPMSSVDGSNGIEVLGDGRPSPRWDRTNSVPV